jgi:hypothetical protein
VRSRQHVLVQPVQTHSLSKNCLHDVGFVFGVSQGFALCPSQIGTGTSGRERWQRSTSLGRDDSGGAGKRTFSLPRLLPGWLTSRSVGLVRIRLPSIHSCWAAGLRALVSRRYVDEEWVAESLVSASEPTGVDMLTLQANGRIGHRLTSPMYIEVSNETEE